MCFFAALGGALGASAASATATGIAATSMGISALSAGMGAVGQRQQAKMQYQAAKQQADQQKRFQEQAAAAERQRALRQMTGERLQQAQQLEGLSRQERERALAKQAGAATEITKFRGVSGLSVQQVQTQYLADLGFEIEPLERQRGLISAGKTLALEDIVLASQQRQIGIDQPIAQPLYQPPSVLGGLFDVAKSGLEGYSSGLTLSRQLGLNKGKTKAEV
jgi:hypothetical protein